MNVLNFLAMYLPDPQGGIPTEEGLEHVFAADAQEAGDQLYAVMEKMLPDRAALCAVESAATLWVATTEASAFRDGMQAGARLQLQLLGLDVPEEGGGRA